MTADRDKAYEETTRAQRNAADPKNSAFIAANAGAGKTRVLTERVARLLLAGTPPQKILCITFTKTAAAEMASRLFKMLGEWALDEDAKLSKALNELRGEKTAPHSADDLAEARRLFARALDTPGGLKIQTIHSFCENVLKRFPLEAAVAPGFSVLEDLEARALAEKAVERAAIACGDDDRKRAVARLAARFNHDTLKSLLIDSVLTRARLMRGLTVAGGWEALAEEAARRLGVGPRADPEALKRAAVDLISPEKMQHVRAVFLHGKKTAAALAKGPVSQFLEAASYEQKFTALRQIFIDSKGNLRSKFGDADTKMTDISAEDYLSEIGPQIMNAIDRVKAADSLQDTIAYFTLIRAAWLDYETKKTARVMLDYDDLIIKTQGLFAARDSAAWVLFKLDQGLDHILLDEAQDTSPAQWDVIDGPLREFFAGEGAREIRRTFFAVGDQKQSIYSFQGADASLFKEKREDLGKRIEAAAPFVAEPLTLSFRSTAPVLRFVDALFEDEEAREGLWEDALRHGVRRAGAAGVVELWPLTPRPDKPDDNPWDAPIKSIPSNSPVRTLSEKVAEEIASWLAGGEKLESADRPVRPGDIMILVQSRGPLFHEVIKALGRAGAPVAGADKLKLLEDAAVEDMLAYARAALLETDDLSLAEVLKSPFFGFNDEDLLELAPDRTGPLWRALADRAGENQYWAAAVADIRRARAVALKQGAYGFLAHILECATPSGRSKLYARLGEASHETIDELLRQALEFELKYPRSLQGFLVWLDQRASEVKREMDQTSNAVRVMTVHGAKGLEAPIVFLLDAHRPPNTRKLGPQFEIVGGASTRSRVSGVVALSAGASDECAALKSARDRAKRLHYEEYRRLLYVAATRARDRLYICGVATGNRGDPSSKAVVVKTWHALACDAFDRLDNVETASHPAWEGEIRRIVSIQSAAPDRKDVRYETGAPAPPDWLHRPAAREEAIRRIAPSALADEEEAGFEPSAYSPTRAYAPFLRGRSLHRLLELLPGLDPADQADAADRLLARLAADVDAGERAAWREEALAVLSDPAFAPVFSPASRAEAAIAGAPKGARAGMVISGQIDRLAVTATEVLIIDYKTNRPPPVRVEEIAPAYIAQLAAYRALLQEIYPRHQIKAGLLWTYEARLTAIPDAILDRAFARHIA